MKVHVDFETRSPVDLKLCGLAPYAAKAEIICMAYAFNEEYPRLWLPGMPLHPMLIDACNDPETTFHAWNAAFEMAIWPLTGLPVVPLERWRCSMAHALACGLPGSLDQAAVAIGSLIRKDRIGGTLIRKFCIPKKTTGEFTDVAPWNETTQVAQRYETVEEAIASLNVPATEARLAWETARFYKYCVGDVNTERSVEHKLPPWQPSEIAVWHLDQKINNRGIPVDLKFAQTAITMCEERSEQLDREITTATGGAVTRASQAARLVTWLQGEGVDIDSMAKGKVKAALEAGDLDDHVELVLSIRQAAAKASVKKYQKIVACASDDSRIRNAVQYCASHTGRWGGRGVQFQNLPRGGIERLEAEWIADVLASSGFTLDQVAGLFGEPLDVFSSLIRATVRSDKSLVVGDFAQIEARVLAWIAGENRILKAFESGSDVYKLMASEIWSIQIEQVDKGQRFIGKCAVLGLGYGMGAAKFIDAVIALGGPRLELEFCQRVVNVFRSTNTKIKQLWYEVEDAAIKAVKSKGEVFSVGKLAFKCVGEWLMMKLPSGRFVYYPFPRVSMEPSPFGMKDAVSYMGLHPKSKKWERLSTYGGKLVENAVQAISRDILVEAMMRLESSPFCTITTIHDEVMTESAEGTAEELNQILKIRPAWAKDCPIDAEAWKGTRYGK